VRKERAKRRLQVAQHILPMDAERSVCRNLRARVCFSFFPAAGCFAAIPRTAFQPAALASERSSLAGAAG
jgi:hypothetical protein